MAEASARTTPAQSPQELFKLWQNGDTAAGQKMAQRFTDWYYAVTAVQLGEVTGRSPLERACGTFAQGITTITRSSELVDWAHGIVAREIRQAGGRGAGGDFPNALTGGRSPTDLLSRARSSLTSTQLQLLAATFDDSVPLSDLITLSEEHGGWPLAILEARYVLKRALRDGDGVNFAVVPEAPDLDRAPMPLYEAARMSSGDEEAYFEKWLLTDLDLCRDVAEFAAFSHALRAGAFKVEAPAAAEPAPAAAPAVREPSAPTPSDERPRLTPEAPLDAPQKPPTRLVLWSAIGVVVVLLAIVAFLFGYFE
jgi:hypothetical protein